MRVRQSGLKAFGECAKQFYYSEIAELGKQQVGSLTVLGTVFHYAAEVYDMYGLDVAKATFKKMWAVPELLGETIDFWHRRTTFDGLEKRGLEMLERYAELSSLQGELIESEAHFIVPVKGGHELEGTIDRLFYRPGQDKLVILDLKTARLVPEKLKYNLQFTAYCYATTTPEFWEQIGRLEMYEKYKNSTRGGVWYHARDAKTYNAGDRDQQDYWRFEMAVEEMARAVDFKVYPLSISGSACGYCPFTAGICGVVE